jgi:hypothetical protein
MLLFLGGGKVAYLIPPLGTFRLTQNTVDVTRHEVIDREKLTKHCECRKYVQWLRRFSLLLWFIRSPSLGLVLKLLALVPNCQEFLIGDFE